MQCGIISYLNVLCCYVQCDIISYLNVLCCYVQSDIISYMNVLCVAMCGFDVMVGRCRK